MDDIRVGLKYQPRIQHANGTSLRNTHMIDEAVPLDDWTPVIPLVRVPTLWCRGQVTAINGENVKVDRMFIRTVRNMQIYAWRRARTSMVHIEIT